MMNLSSNRPPRRFLVISTTGIGDTLMGTPALRALRESFPGSEIHVLVNSRKKELLRGNPHVDRVIGYRNNWFYRRYLAVKLQGLFYDHVLIFHANEDVLEIFKSLAYGDCYSRQNFSDPDRRIYRLTDLPQHSIQRRLRLIEKIGGRVSDDYRYTLCLPDSAARWASQRLSRWGIKAQDRVVGLQLGANDVFKCWPVESFVDAARYLRGRWGAKIYINASSEEKHLLRRFLRGFGSEDVVFARNLSLTQSAALIQACSLFISCDTGPMHMSIGLQVPLIALFCPTDHRETGPLGFEKSIVIQKSIPCTPCLTRGCRDNFCLKQITVEQVCRAADRIFTGSGENVEALQE